MTKRTVKRRYRCTGHELIQTWSIVKRFVDGEVTLVEVEGVQLKSCAVDATVIAQVALPCLMKELCADCLKRYRKLAIVQRGFAVVSFHSGRASNA